MAILSTLIALLALSASVFSHTQSPEEIRAEVETRNRLIAHSKRTLEKCADSPAAVALRERAVARLAAKADTLREKRGMKTIKERRDEAALERYLTVSHDMTSTGYDVDTPLSTIFGSNATCALVPETVVGPYYVEGEQIRSDITGGQAGIASHVDLQFIDINTCEPVSQLLIDVWHCNATGAYSGVSSSGQGGLNSTFSRGVQQSDSDGVTEFDTVFPGHYAGRATHIHVISTANATVRCNGTFTGGTARHIGQLYFDTSLREAVEQVEPYSSNSQPITANADDQLAADEASDEYDPFMRYVQLGDDVADGLLLWMTIGIDTSADYNDNVTPAAHYYDGGGVSEDNGSGGGPGGDFPGGDGPGGLPGNTTTTSQA